jgi:hypothetical protein
MLLGIKHNKMVLDCSLCFHFRFGMLFGRLPLFYTTVKETLEQIFLNCTIKNEKAIQKFRIKYEEHSLHCTYLSHCLA